MNKYEMKMAIIENMIGALEYEEGSEEQIDHENAAFFIAGELFVIDWEDHPYLLKATVEERIAYLEKVTGIEIPRDMCGEICVTEEDLEN